MTDLAFPSPEAVRTAAATAAANERNQMEQLRPVVRQLAKSHIVNILQQKLQTTTTGSASFSHTDLLALEGADALRSTQVELVAWAWRLECKDIFYSLPIASKRGGYKVYEHYDTIVIRPWDGDDTRGLLLGWLLVLALIALVVSYFLWGK